MADEQAERIPPEFCKGERHTPKWSFCFMDSTRIEAGENIIPAILQSNLGREFADLHMIANDFSFALECLTEANKIGLPDSENLPSKSLIFSAVVAYARPFMTAVRARIDKPYFSKVATFSFELHDYLMAVRNKHVAHSVNDFERAEATGVMVGTPQTQWRPAGIGIATTFAVGLSRKLVEQAIMQIDGMLAAINVRIVEMRPDLFQEFCAQIEEEGKWQVAPFPRLPDRDKVDKRRS
jgi:hypothetical protein